MESLHLKEALARLDGIDESKLFKRFFDSLIEHVALLDIDGNIVATNKSWDKFSSENSGIEACRANTLNYISVSESAVGNAADEALQVAEV